MRIDHLLFAHLSVLCYHYPVGYSFMQGGMRMTRQFKIIVEKHPDGYVAYPLGPKGVVVGEGDTYEDALADVKSCDCLSYRDLWVRDLRG